jgi:hypothetical protein
MNNLAIIFMTPHTNFTLNLRNYGCENKLRNYKCPRDKLASHLPQAATKRELKIKYTLL